MAPPLLIDFIAGSEGDWRISKITAIRGETLPNASYLEVVESTPNAPRSEGVWTLRGSTGNARYSNRAEINTLVSRQEPLGRPHANRAVLVPIRKNAAWWNLAQDERRAILEEKSRHIAIGLKYLPAIARQLHHSRELGEPFDFLTWFEFEAGHTDAFDALLARLRETEEWDYVEREVEVRMERAD